MNIYGSYRFLKSNYIKHERSNLNRRAQFELRDIPCEVKFLVWNTFIHNYWTTPIRSAVSSALTAVLGPKVLI
jgi:hypothetical protein